MEGFLLRNFVLLVLLVVPAWFQSDAPIVNTKTGPVRGTTLFYKGTAVNAFLGIPYAKPPVKELRFKRTVPVEKWNDTRDATRLSPACLQVPQYSPALDSTSVQSEDCLYLNIWVPSTAENADKKAVMVFIHGGSFTQGSTAKPIYDGLILAARGGVIVASPNYRLGILGFGTAHIEDAPGNAGMFDQVEALKWINENIETFGGNSSCITLFGESAGSMSISAHAVSPLSKDLFQRCIMESGSIAFLACRLNNAKLTIQPVYEFTDLIAASVGCSDILRNVRTNPEYVVECLRKVDARKLTDASAPYPVVPQYGDEFLPDEARLSIIKGEMKTDNLLIGVNADEGSLFLVLDDPERFGVKGKKNEHPHLCKFEATLILTKLLTLYGFDPVATASIIVHYLSKAHGDCNEDVLRETFRAIGDCLIVCPSVYTAEKIAQLGKNVYFYYFGRRPSISNDDFGEWMGVAHFMEVQYVFGMPLRDGATGYTKKDRHLSRRIINAWTDFAKTGSPSSSWPLYSRDNAYYKVLNTTKYPKTGYGPSRDDCDFLREFNGYE